MDPALTDEEERFMKWLEEGDVTGHHAGDAPDLPAEWHKLRHNVDSLRDLLRANIPSAQEPPGSASFNDEVRQKLD